MKRASLAFVCVVALAVLAGCGDFSSSTSGGRVQMVSSRAITWLQPYVPSPQDYRWLDIGDNPFSSGFQSSFTYTGTQLQVDYQDSAQTLTGTLMAQGLKPNFAYQLKLEGQPTMTYAESQGTADARDWANLQIGSIGRWWCTDASHIGNEHNRTDADLAAGICDEHWVLGYLLFDFFVTDAGGDGLYSFGLDSSFHVLWKTTQRRPGSNDGPQSTYKISGSAAYGYDSDFSQKKPISIYAEWEPSRPLPGQVVLPEGDYKCRLLVTEESFHANMGGRWGTDPLGGFWAHVLSDENLMFTVSGGPPPPTETGAISGKVTNGNNKPVQGANVEADSGEWTSTNKPGRYTLEGGPGGRTDRYGDSRRVHHARADRYRGGGRDG